MNIDRPQAQNRSQEIESMIGKLDQTAITELKKMMGEEDFPIIFEDLLVSYLEDSPKLVKNLCIARQNQNPDEIKINAHTLNSSSSSLGAVKLSQLCQQLEQEISAGNIMQASKLIDEIVDEYEKVAEIMQLELDHLSSK